MQVSFKTAIQQHCSTSQRSSSSCSEGQPLLASPGGVRGDLDQSWPALITKSGALHYLSCREGGKARFGIGRTVSIHWFTIPSSEDLTPTHHPQAALTTGRACLPGTICPKPEFHLKLCLNQEPDTNVDPGPFLPTVHKQFQGSASGFSV